MSILTERIDAMKKKIFVISGFSGAGKDTVLEKVLQIEKSIMKECSKIWVSKSDTTRPARNKADHYTFISKDEFLKRANAGYYLEMNNYNTGFLYGTPLQPVLEANGIVVIQVDVNGMHQIVNHPCLKEIPIITVFIGINSKTLLHRLQHRGDNDSEISVRLRTASVEVTHINEYDYVLINDDADNTAVRLWSIFFGIPVVSDNIDGSEFSSSINKFLSLSHLPRIHEPFYKVVRYKCSYCGKEFITSTRHKCKFNPDYRNCFSCENAESIYSVFVNGDILQKGESNYSEKAFSCLARCSLSIRSLKNLSESHWHLKCPCSSYKEIDNYSGKETFLKHLLFTNVNTAGRNRVDDYTDYLASMDIPVTIADDHD